MIPQRNYTNQLQGVNTMYQVTNLRRNHLMDDVIHYKDMLISIAKMFESSHIFGEMERLQKDIERTLETIETNPHAMEILLAASASELIKVHQSVPKEVLDHMLDISRKQAYALRSLYSISTTFPIEEKSIDGALLDEEILANETDEKLNDPNDTKESSPIYTGSNNLKEQEVRPFQLRGKGFIYRIGNHVDSESGASILLEPSREFKEFNTRDPKTGQLFSDEQLTEAFVHRAGKFICACLNRRCNGTMYFGVSDDGVIVGCYVPVNKKGFYEEVMTKYFSGKNPQYFNHLSNAKKNAVESCLRTLQFISLEGHDDLKVIELDVCPDSEICGEFDFSVLHKKKGEREPKWFVRKNNASEQYKDLDVKQMVKEYAKERRRQEQESQLQGKSFSTAERIERIMCGGSNMINDEELHYILVTSEISCMKSFSDWITKVKWYMVFDFSSNSDLHSCFKNDTNLQLKLPLKQKASELASYGSLTDLRLGERTLLVDCHVNDKSMWMSECSRGITKLLFDITNPKILSDTIKAGFVILIILDSAPKMKWMAIVFIELLKTFPSENFLILFEDDSIGNQFKERIGSYIQESSNERFVLVNWVHLSNIMTGLLPDITEDKKGFVIANSSGNFSPVPDLLYESYREAGLELLPANQEDEANHHPDKRSRIESANKRINDFLMGAKPDWDVFAFTDTSITNISCTGVKITPGLVRRNCVNTLVKEIRLLSIEKNVCVLEKNICHMPGSGANTIACNVLWDLRKTMRCICVDADVKQGETQIRKMCETLHELRELGEGEAARTKRVTVVVMIDNANENYVAQFTRSLQSIAHNRKIKFYSVGFILLCLTRKINPFQGERGGATLLDQRLTKDEKLFFRSRLEELEKFKNISLETMLSFVIMASEFDFNSDYVKRYVRAALEKISSSEEALILYLSILKKYCNSNLPSHHAYKIGLKTLHSTWTERKRWDMLSSGAKMLLVKNTTENVYNNEVIGISHAPVAYVVCHELISARQQKVQIAVHEMLKNKYLLGEEFEKPWIQRTLRKLLLARPVNNGDDEKQFFSPLITEVTKESNRTEAKLLLEEGFRALRGSPHEAFVAQGLARFHLKHGDFEEAKKWAKEAIELFPTCFTLYDTLGQIYKKELRRYSRRESSKSVAIEDLLLLASTASKNFMKAFDHFKQNITWGNSSIPLEDILENEPSIMPSAVGQIVTSLEALKHLFKFERLVPGGEMRKSFIKDLISGDRGAVIEEILREMRVNSDDAVSYVKNLFEVTKVCFNVVSMQHIYVDGAKGGRKNEEYIEKQVKAHKERQKEFEFYFGVKDLSKAIAKEPSVITKVSLCRRQLASTCATSFGWLVSFDGEFEFRRNELFTQLLYDLSISYPEHSLVSEDKVIYMNVTFGLHYLNCTTELNVQEVRKFCQELVQAEVRYPEPYFFYLLLFWPNDDTLEVDVENFRMLCRCQSELVKQEAKTSFGGGTTKRSRHSRTLFYLSNGRGLDRVKSAKDASLNHFDGEVVRLKGLIDETKNIECHLTPSGKWTLKLRAVSLANRTTTKGQKVTYSVGFGFSGAFAFNIVTEEEEIEAARRKVLLDHANDRFWSQ